MSLRLVAVGHLEPMPGGAARSISQLLPRLADAGIEICALGPVTADDITNHGDRYAARNPQLRLLRFLVPYHHVEPYRPRAAAHAESEDRQIRAMVRELVGSFRPDLLVAAHECHAQVIASLAREADLPYCVWLRGSPTAQILRGTHPEDQTREVLDIYRGASCLIAAARYFAEGLADRFGIEGVATVPNAVDLARFVSGPRCAELRERHGLAPSDRLVLLPGLLIMRKRPHDLLRAAAQVLATRGDVVFLLAGEGSLRPELEELARTLGIGDRVRMPGMVAYERMAELYNAADLVVMTTEAEGLSRVYLEALACGRPLLASDIAAGREVVVDGRNGFLFRMGDVEHLARRILELLARESLPAAIGSAARASVADRTLERAVAAYTTLLRGAVRR